VVGASEGVTSALATRATLGSNHVFEPLHSWHCNQCSYMCMLHSCYTVEPVLAGNYLLTRRRESIPVST